MKVCCGTELHGKSEFCVSWLALLLLTRATRYGTRQQPVTRKGARYAATQMVSGCVSLCLKDPSQPTHFLLPVNSLEVLATSAAWEREKGGAKWTGKAQRT